jgi:hypothetical protein
MSKAAYPIRYPPVRYIGAENIGDRKIDGLPIKTSRLR